MIRWLLAVLLILPQPQGLGLPLGSAGPVGGNHLSFIQACKNIDAATTTSHTLIMAASGGSCSVPQNVVNGDLVTVWIGYRANPTSQSCADNLGNTWTSVVSTTNLQGYCWSIISNGGSSMTLTITSGSAVFGVEVGLEISGSAASPLDAAATTSSLGTGSSSWNGASYTSANANDIIIGCGSFNNNLTVTQGSGFTIPSHGQTSNGTPFAGYCEYQIVTATGTFTPPASTSSSTTNLFTFTVGFKSS